MTSPAPWALSALDLAAHLLVRDGDHPRGVLKARCGEVLPLMSGRFARPLSRRCGHCQVIFLDGASARKDQ